MAQFYTLDEAARVLGMNPEDLKAEAQQRKVRAFLDGGTWRFQSKRGDQERWEYYGDPELADLQSFREILFRKYQRSRAAFEDVQWADRELARRRQEG